MSANKEPIEPEHHKQQEFCQNRPLYRRGRNLTAVKVYTVANESQHLLIYEVPKINLRTELKSLCMKYGQIKKIHVTTDYKTEAFTECYHVLYERIQSARIAKRFLDNRSFYGGVLHVCYAPELENVAETRAKLEQRKRDIHKRLNGIVADETATNPTRKSQDVSSTNSEPEAGPSHQIPKSVIWNGVEFNEPPKKMRKLDPDPPPDNPHRTFIGPQLPKEKAEKTCLLPTPVMKKRLNYSKTIVFKNKKPKNK